jgi:hypothetical protein
LFIPEEVPIPTTRREDLGSVLAHQVGLRAGKVHALGPRFLVAEALFGATWIAHLIHTHGTWRGHGERWARNPHREEQSSQFFGIVPSGVSLSITCGNT